MLDPPWQGFNIVSNLPAYVFRIADMVLLHAKQLPSKISKFRIFAVLRLASSGRLHMVVHHIVLHCSSSLLDFRSIASSELLKTSHGGA